MPNRPTPITNDRLLDAAEEVVLSRGADALTLDSVAAAASVSKGGLLHHYPSKERLLGAMVCRIVTDWRQDFEHVRAAQPAGPGRTVRTMIAHCMVRPELWDDHLRRRSQVLFAATIADSALCQPLRNCFADFASDLAGDGLMPGTAETIQAVIDGLWFQWIFGLVPMTETRLDLIRARVMDLLTHGAAGQVVPPVVFVDGHGEAAAGRAANVAGAGMCGGSGVAGGFAGSVEGGVTGGKGGTLERSL